MKKDNSWYFSVLVSAITKNTESTVYCNLKTCFSLEDATTSDFSKKMHDFYTLESFSISYDRAW